MKLRTSRAMPVFAATMLLSGVTWLAAQSGHGDHGNSSVVVSEVFCAAKSTGQLCNHGTADTLKLSGPKRDRWVQIANQYNRTVQAATEQLLREAKAELSPEEYAQVAAWFDKARNTELNQQLGRLLAAK